MRCGLLAGVVLLGVSAGCAEPKVPVRGTVTFDGQPIEEGMIAFEPADGVGPTTGGTIKDGRYELTGEACAIPGEKVVRIAGLRKTGRTVPAGNPYPPGTLVDEMVQCVPPHCNDRSKLRVQITPRADNTHDFHLKKVP